eukprot:7381940-Prymnesium_polylepis.4
MHHNNLTLVCDNYYGGETPLLKLWEVGIESVCTINKNAVSHVFEKRDTGVKYKSGAKAGEAKLTAALLPGEYRTAVATVPDPRGAAGATMQARLPAQELPDICVLLISHSRPPTSLQVYYKRFKDKGDFGTLSMFITPEREARVMRTSTVEKVDANGTGHAAKGRQGRDGRAISSQGLHSKVRRRRHERCGALLPLVRPRLACQGPPAAVSHRVLGARC